MNHPIFARIYARRSVAEAHLQEAYRRELLGRALGPGTRGRVRQRPELRLLPAFGHRGGRRRTGAVPAPPGPPRLHEGAARPPGRRGSGRDGLRGGHRYIRCRRVLIGAVQHLRPEGRVGGSQDGYSTTARPSASTSMCCPTTRTAARLQRLFAPLWSSLAGGCRPDRDTLTVHRGGVRHRRCAVLRFLPRLPDPPRHRGAPHLGPRRLPVGSVDRRRPAAAFGPAATLSGRGPDR